MKCWHEMSDREKVLDLVSDLVTNLLYFNREECETFRVGDIDKLVNSGVVTINEIVAEFRKHLVKELKDG